jgi:hypothetical protein
MTVATFIGLPSPHLNVYLFLYRVANCTIVCKNYSSSTRKRGFMDGNCQPNVLISATLWWPSSARLAMAFLRHGCNVSALCPPGHPLRFVTGISSIYSYQSLASIGSLGAAIRAAQPTLIVPCDDMAVWQLHALHANEPDLRPLIELSLGAAEAYPDIQHRGEVLRIAQSLGIRVPFTHTLNSAEELKDWNFDKPAVLKLDGTWGGEGVTIVRSLAEATQSFHSAPKTMNAWMAWKRFVINRHFFAFWAWQRRKISQMTIQEFIPGRPATTMFACWRGEVLASSTVEVLVSQAPTGAANVVQVLKNNEIEDAVRLLARKFQLSGFHGLDFVVEQDTDAAYLIELNPRATQLGHLSISAQGDLAGVMARNLKNEAADGIAFENQIQNSTIAFFPHAYKSAPESVYLHQGYHDVPWDEPALVRELLCDSWPERQWASRIFYHYLGLGKRTLPRSIDRSIQDFAPDGRFAPKPSEATTAAVYSAGRLPVPDRPAPEAVRPSTIAAPAATDTTVAAPRCAVVFKTYAWDGFVERQARRLAEAAGALDFYVSVDETNGSVGSIPFERVTRFTCAGLAASGLPMRFSVGSVLWWNPDYAHYQFLSQYPDYEYYLFVEYDCIAQCSLEQFVNRAASRGADFVALPILRPFSKWHWMTYQRDVYSADEVKLSLLNVCLFSAPALKMLHQRRLAMSSQPSIRSWPSSEVFVPTEVARAGMTSLSLADFGNVSHCDWFPPMMEEDLRPSNGDAFLHPVLDRRRYVSSMLYNRGSLQPGELERALSRFRHEEYAKLIWPAARQSAVRRVQHKLVQWRHQVGFLTSGPGL